ncbi:hypothetical protein EHR01_05665 [Leptospira mtsangambouensis]|uniref:Class I SAM-dependent methyltransferase n=1 Tax=Leptospira mtsangambouensis TaxID=2484912 RepID=A0ABY2P475_9LEPT|nr:hypothetical protein [Leptospira mtsangambouensis]TGM82269.1 hypothetical protein EHR01_05665 [Leptospira mtsangambouensis]
MYDFYYGSKEEILKNPANFILFCKRLLPRWLNGTPDSECLAIWKILNEAKNKPKVLVETGSGASSLVFFIYCALNDGRLFSWDTNGSKGSYLRSIISDAICKPLGIDIHKVWTFIPFNSTDKHVGIESLSELGLKADFGFFDSWHTWDHLHGEIQAFETVANSEFIVALDDAYYDKKSYNYSFVNMLRKKMGLAPVSEPKDNKCLPFYSETENLLNANFKAVLKIEDSYKTSYSFDVFFDYFEYDRIAMNKLGLEEKHNLDHRFDAWHVTR